MNKSKKPYVVFDLDGCLSDDRHRLHLLPSIPLVEDSEEGKLWDYGPYHAKLSDDEPINLEILQAHLRGGKTPIFVTSRPESVRGKTVDWLKDKAELERANFALIMRPNGDLRPSPDLKVALLESFLMGILSASEQYLRDSVFSFIAAAYDDRADVLEAYRKAGITRLGQIGPSSLEAAPVELLEGEEIEALSPGVPEVLRAMAATFEERNAEYGDNYKYGGEVIRAFFPDEIPADVARRPEFMLFMLLLTKVSRFAESELTHLDSVHDLAVYAAMIESLLREREIESQNR